MPYIQNEQRQALNQSIDNLAAEIAKLHAGKDKPNKDGLLNYSLTRLLNKLYPDARYRDYNEIIGMLECCKLEYYRKYASPYEDQKEQENGAVEVFNKGSRTNY